MKSLLKSVMVIAISSLFFIYGCEKNPATPDDENQNNLTDSEQMLIVAAEVSENNGGLMADVEMAKSISTGEVGNLMKVVSFDTTITYSWITYSLSLSYYSANNQEQPRYIETRTDKVVYNGALSGSNTGIGSYQKITLDRNTSLDITNVISDTLNANGTSTNKSEYKFSYDQVNLTVNTNSTIDVQNLKVLSNSATYFPFSGKIEAKIKGKFSATGKRQQQNVDYDFNVTVQFTGGSQVKITLPSGSQYSLNLTTGDFSKVS